MGIGARIREERGRLSLSQAEFAALAGASKGAQLKWEKEESSPTGAILSAWAEAGADVLYILTGRRTADRPDDAASRIEGRLASIRRDLLEDAPSSWSDQNVANALEMHASELSAFSRDDAANLSAETQEEVQGLLHLATNPAALSLYRAGEAAQRRGQRRKLKERLSAYLHGGPYLPSETVNNLLAMLALDYGAPFDLLAELVEEIHDDIVRRNPPGPRNMGKMEPQR